MNKTIKTKVRNVVIVSFGLLLVFALTNYFILWISYKPEDMDIKGIISNTVSAASAIATLAAAIIAAYLFTDWKEQSHMQAKHNAAKDVLLSISKLSNLAVKYESRANLVVLNPENINEAECNKLKDLLSELIDDFSIKYHFYKKAYDEKKILPILTGNSNSGGKFNLFNFYYHANTIISGKYFEDPQQLKLLQEGLKKTKPQFLQGIEEISDILNKDLFFQNEDRS